jgi:anaerobic magnesium-protoporphyrin IX monomethyl ester cyclase
VSRLDDLPLPDRSLFDYPRLQTEREGGATMMASRGCPYNCTYCCNKALREAMGNAKPLIRFHSVDYVIRQAKDILANYDFVKKIQFDDDILFLEEAWAEEFAERFPREIGLPFVSNLRPNLASEKTVSLLSQAGCKEVRIGLESGNDHIRTQILGRKIPRQQIVDTVRLCHQYGMRVMSYNIVGLPFETPYTVLDTIKLNAEIGADDMNFTIFQPYAGTELHKQSRQHGFLRGPAGYDLDFYSDSILEQPTITRRQVRMFRHWYHPLVRIYRAEARIPGPAGRLAANLTTAFLATRAGNLAADGVFRVMHPLYMKIKARRAADRAGVRVA